MKKIIKNIISILVLVLIIISINTVNYLNIIPNKINNILLTHFHGDHYFVITFCFI